MEDAFSNPVSSIRLKLDRVPTVMSTAILHNVVKVLKDSMHNLQSLEDEHDMAIILPYIDDHPQQVRVAGEDCCRLMPTICKVYTK